LRPKDSQAQEVKSEARYPAPAGPWSGKRFYHAFPLGGGRAQLDLIPDDARKFKQAADAAGLALTRPKRAFLITRDDRVGAAAEHAKKLADAKVNITAVTALTGGSGRYGMLLWVASGDFDKAAAALGA
jgi:hypothetical protein